MKRATSKLTSKGQVTIPAAIRQHLGLKEGDKVIFTVEDDGSVHVSAPRYPTVDSMTGAAGKLERPLSLHEMLEIAHEERFLAKRARQS